MNRPNHNFFTEKPMTHRTFLAILILIFFTVNSAPNLIGQQKESSEQKNQNIDFPRPEKVDGLLGPVKFRHRSPVQNLTWIESKNQIASGDRSGNVVVWNKSSGKPEHLFSTSETAMEKLVATTDGKLLFGINKKGRGFCWNLNSGKQLHARKKINGDVTALETANRKRIVFAATKKGDVHVLRMTTGAIKKTINTGSKEILALDASPVENKFVVAQKHGSVIEWDADTKKELNQLHEGTAYDLMYAPSGKEVYVYTGDQTIRISTESEKITNRKWAEKGSGRGALRYMSLSGSGKYLVRDRIVHRHHHHIRVRNTETGELLYEKTLNDIANGRTSINRKLGNNVFDLAVNQEDGTIALATAGGFIEQISLKTGNTLLSRTEHRNRVTNLISSPSGNLLASAERKKTIVWNGPEGTVKFTAKGSRPLFTQDGRFLVTRNTDHIFLFETASGKLRKKHSLSSFPTYRWGISKSGNEVALISRDGKNGKYPMWRVQLKSGDVQKQNVITDGEPSRIHYDRNNHLLIVSLTKKGYSSQYIGTKSNRSFTTGFTNRDFDLDNQHWSDRSRIAPFLVGLGTGKKRTNTFLWNYETGNRLVHVQDSPWAACPTLSSAGYYSVFSEGNRIKIIENWTGKVIRTLEPADEVIDHVTFSADGRYLYSAGTLKWIHRWDLRPPIHNEKFGRALPEKQKLLNLLSTKNAKKAHRAQWKLVRTPEKSVEWIKNLYHEEPSESRKNQVEKWLNELGDQDYDTRTKALEKLTEQFYETPGKLISAAKKKRKTTSNPETKKNIQKLLNRTGIIQHPIPGKRLRVLRALNVLRQIGTDAARRVLKDISSNRPSLEARIAEQFLNQILDPSSKAK